MHKSKGIARKPEKADKKGKKGRKQEEDENFRLMWVVDKNAGSDDDK